MERRVLLAVVLSFVVLYGFQALFPSPDQTKKPLQDSKPATVPNASAPEGANPAPSVRGPAAGPATTPGAAASAAAPAATETRPARDFVLDTERLHATFTSHGAAISSWQLKKYRDSDGRPLELLAGHAPSDSPLPLTIGTDDAAVSAKLAKSDYTVTKEPSGPSAWQIDFRFADDSGLVATKSFSYSSNQPYQIQISASVTLKGQAQPVTLRWGPALGSGVVVKSRTYNPPPQPIFFKDGKVTRVTAAKIAQQTPQDGTFGFAGVDDHYFITAAVKPAEPLHLEYQAMDVPLNGVAQGAHYVSWAVRYPGSIRDAKFFAGPKDFDILAATDRDLVRAIDFGMFAWIVVPLLRALDWINLYIGNYGWSLIILTILINVVMLPLRHKSVVSMRKMQEVQPQVKAIQDRYSNLKMSDPGRAKMNQELMALYKEKGANPASGCVPMLLTLPLIYAFYAMLSVAIELRGAPFVGWIHDLSAPDPLFVTPVIMGITMFVQQRMTPASADPTQQKMMTVLMPVMFTGMFLWAASGLTIYWTVSNIWNIAQQMVTNKLIGPPAVRTVTPPAVRQLKPPGGGSNKSKER